MPRLDEPPVDLRHRLAGGAGRKRHGQLQLAGGNAGGDPGLLEETARRGGVGAVQPDGTGARGADELTDRALPDDPPAVDDRDRVAGALDLVEQV